MPEQVLDHTNVDTLFEQMGRKTVSQSVDSDQLAQPGGLGRSPACQPDVLDRRGHGGERHLHLSAEQVIQCKGDAAVRHVNNVNAGHDFEQLAGHVGWRHKIRQRRPLVAHHGPCTCGQRSGPSVRYAPMMALVPTIDEE